MTTSVSVIGDEMLVRLTGFTNDKAMYEVPGDTRWKMRDLIKDGDFDVISEELIKNQHYLAPETVRPLLEFEERVGLVGFNRALTLREVKREIRDYGPSLEELNHWTLLRFNAYSGTVFDLAEMIVALGTRWVGKPALYGNLLFIKVEKGPNGEVVNRELGMSKFPLGFNPGTFFIVSG